MKKLLPLYFIDFLELCFAVYHFQLFVFYCIAQKFLELCFAVYHFQLFVFYCIAQKHKVKVYYYNNHQIMFYYMAPFFALNRVNPFNLFFIKLQKNYPLEQQKNFIILIKLEYCIINFFSIHHNKGCMGINFNFIIHNIQLLYQNFIKLLNANIII